MVAKERQTWTRNWQSAVKPLMGKYDPGAMCLGIITYRRPSPSVLYGLTRQVVIYRLFC